MNTFSGDGPVRDVDPVEAARLTEAGEVLLLDVREYDEWAAGHAAEATHIPMGRLRPGMLPANRVIVAVCRSGHRSGQVAEALQAGGTDARNLAGGMNAWARSGLPVVCDDGRPGTVI